MPHPLTTARRAALAVLLCSIAPSAGLTAQGMKASELRADMLKPCEDHITWTLPYIVDATRNLPEKDATLQRLLKNQTDIGNAIKPFYGDAAGEKLTGLLKTHITIAGEIVAAAMAGDNA